MLEWLLPPVIKVHPADPGTVDLHPQGPMLPHSHLIAEAWPVGRKQRAAEHIDWYHAPVHTHGGIG